MADQNPADTSFGGTSIISRMTSFKPHRFTVLVQLLDDSEQLSLQFKVGFTRWNYCLHQF